MSLLSYELILDGSGTLKVLRVPQVYDLRPRLPFRLGEPGALRTYRVSNPKLYGKKAFRAGIVIFRGDQTSYVALGSPSDVCWAMDVSRGHGGITRLKAHTALHEEII